MSKENENTETLTKDPKSKAKKLSLSRVDSNELDFTQFITKKRKYGEKSTSKKIYDKNHEPSHFKDPNENDNYSKDVKNVEDTIKVMIRIKPFSNEEISKIDEKKITNCIKHSDKQIKICNPLFIQKWGEYDSCWKEFNFHKIIGPKIENKNLFNHDIKSYLKNIMKGK